MARGGIDIGVDGDISECCQRGERDDEAEQDDVGFGSQDVGMNSDGIGMNGIDGIGVDSSGMDGALLLCDCLGACFRMRCIYMDFYCALAAATHDNRDTDFGHIDYIMESQYGYHLHQSLRKFDAGLPHFECDLDVVRSAYDEDPYESLCVSRRRTGSV